MRQYVRVSAFAAHIAFEFLFPFAYSSRAFADIVRRILVALVMSRRDLPMALAIASTLFLLFQLPAGASQIVGKWWDGSWNCTIDGRPARMRWLIVNDAQGTSSGGVATTTSGVKRVGRFSDNGSAWVALSEASEGNNGGLFFRHADGNQWYLPKPQGGRTSGWTTWQGKRYPLICWR
jgi:hypothetical protein